jgi:hypothetical protein
LINRTPGFSALLQAYLDFQPIRERHVAAPGDCRSDGTWQLYFAQRWGMNATFINVDDRSYRDIPLSDLQRITAGTFLAIVFFASHFCLRHCPQHYLPLRLDLPRPAEGALIARLKRADLSIIFPRFRELRSPPRNTRIATPSNLSKPRPETVHPQGRTPTSWNC